MQSDLLLNSCMWKILPSSLMILIFQLSQKRMLRNWFLRMGENTKSQWLNKLLRVILSSQRLTIIEEHMNLRTIENKRFYQSLSKIMESMRKFNFLHRQNLKQFYQKNLISKQNMSWKCMRRNKMSLNMKKKENWSKRRNNHTKFVALGQKSITNVSIKVYKQGICHQVFSETMSLRKFKLFKIQIMGTKPTNLSTPSAWNGWKTK